MGNLNMFNKSWLKILPDLIIWITLGLSVGLFSFKLAGFLSTKQPQPFPFEQVLILIFLSAIALGFRLNQKLKFSSFPKRVMVFTMPSFIFLGIFLILTRILSTPFWEWNAARLAPTFALVKGYQLYYGQNDGAVLNTIYGPVTAITFLPATLFHSLNWSVICASFIGSLIFFLPAFYVLAHIPLFHYERNVGFKWLYEGKALAL
jgi:hypothetical protein